MAMAAARAADERKAREVLVLDLRGRSQCADFFVIATGLVAGHLKAVGEAVVARLAELGCRPLSLGESASSSGWTLLDFGPVVAHAFTPELRAYYDLELLWGDAPRVDWAAD